VRKALPLLALLAGCATAPTGPHVLVLPGTGKSFDQFRADEQECRQYAQAQVGTGTGGLAGSGGGRGAQQRYDFGYQQCMYAKGHKVPMSRAEAERYSSKASTPPPPPPPAGKPPGVPPDYK
jgi:hypothetical protein